MAGGLPQRCRPAGREPAAATPAAAGGDRPLFSAGGLRVAGGVLCMGLPRWRGGKEEGRGGGGGSCWRRGGCVMVGGGRGGRGERTRGVDVTKTKRVQDKQMVRTCAPRNSGSGGPQEPHHTDKKLRSTATTVNTPAARRPSPQIPTRKEPALEPTPLPSQVPPPAAALPMPWPRPSTPTSTPERGRPPPRQAQTARVTTPAPVA